MEILQTIFIIISFVGFLDWFIQKNKMSWRIEMLEDKIEDLEDEFGQTNREESGNIDYLEDKVETLEDEIKDLGNRLGKIESRNVQNQTEDYDE